MGFAKSDYLFADNSVMIGPETAIGLDLKLEPIQQQKLLLFGKGRTEKDIKGWEIIAYGFTD